MGNTIRNVKDRIKQERLSPAQIENLEDCLTSKHQKHSLLEKLELALSLLQNSGAKRDLNLIEYFKIFKIQGVCQELKDI